MYVQYMCHSHNELEYSYSGVANMKYISLWDHFLGQLFFCNDNCTNNWQEKLPATMAGTNIEFWKQNTINNNFLQTQTNLEDNPDLFPNPLSSYSSSSCIIHPLYVYNLGLGLK